MKILHVINHMNMGGAQSLLAELVPEQIAMGHEVSVLELEKSTDLTLTHRLASHGVRVESLSSGRSCRNPLNVFSLLPYFKVNDVVHVHLFPANYWIALSKILSFSNVPIVTTEHSTDNRRRHIAVFKYIDAFIYGRYESVIACSDKALDTFKKRFPKVKCESIPNGIGLKHYKSAVPYCKMELAGVPEDSFVFTMVARFQYPKRQDILVRALAEMPETCHCVLVGGAQDDEGVLKVKKLSEELRVNDRVHFLYTRADVPAILKSSDAVVLSSEYEGLSLSSIEGLASGKPVVASDVQGLREVIGGVGELFGFEDHLALSRILTRMSEDKDYSKEIADRCSARAEEYDIASTAKMYDEVYNRISCRRY